MHERGEESRKCPIELRYSQNEDCHGHRRDNNANLRLTGEERQLRTKQNELGIGKGKNEDGKTGDWRLETAETATTNP